MFCVPHAVPTAATTIAKPEYARTLADRVMRARIIRDNRRVMSPLANRGRPRLRRAARAALVLAAAASIAVPLAGCGGSTTAGGRHRTLTITLAEDRIVPPTSTAPARVLAVVLR